MPVVVLARDICTSDEIKLYLHKKYHEMRISVFWNVIFAGLVCPNISEKELSTFVFLLGPLYAQR